MARSDDSSTPEQARADLARVRELTDAAGRRGLYPRWFAVLTCLWAGSLAVAVGIGSPLLLPLLFGGFLSWAWWRRIAGATAREVRNLRELWIVVPLGIGIGAVFIAGRVLFDDVGVGSAPWLAGVFVATMLYIVMELTHGRAWAVAAGRRAEGHGQAGT